MSNFKKLLIIAAGIVLGTSIAPTAHAQLISNPKVVTLNATLTESLTVNVTAGATVNFALLPNTAANPGNKKSTITTTWVLKPGRTQVGVWAWVANGTAALTDGAGGNIPASAVSAAASGSGSVGGALNLSVSGGPGVPAFVTPAAATGVQIGSVAITGANKSSSTTTTLTWNIDTTVANFPAASYTGTVNIQAQATP